MVAMTITESARHWIHTLRDGIKGHVVAFVLTDGGVHDVDRSCAQSVYVSLKRVEDVPLWLHKQRRRVLLPNRVLDQAAERVVVIAPRQMRAELVEHARSRHLANADTNLEVARVFSRELAASVRADEHAGGDQGDRANEE